MKNKRINVKLHECYRSPNKGALFHAMKKLQGIFKHTYFFKKSIICNTHKGLLQQTATLDKKDEYISKKS